MTKVSFCARAPIAKKVVDKHFALCYNVFESEGDKMTFYFNGELNVCADETWVADYLYMSGAYDSRDEAIFALRTQHEVYGWWECEVSNSISEKFD